MGRRHLLLPTGGSQVDVLLTCKSWWKELLMSMLVQYHPAGKNGFNQVNSQQEEISDIYPCPISPKDIKKGVDELPNIFDMVSPYAHAMDMLTH